MTVSIDWPLAKACGIKCSMLHLIPHAFANGQSIDTVMIWTLSGLIFMLLLLRWFHFHQYDFAKSY